MSQIQNNDELGLVAQVIINGDLSKLSAKQRVDYYNGYCQRLGLDAFTKPFDLLKLNGREILYCTRSGAQQLNKLHNVSHAITSRETNAEAGVYMVTSRACLPDGRCTESIGAVNIQGLKGDNYANAVMKAETKAKRRATLDLLGLGVLDETEVESIATMPKSEMQPIPAPVLSEADIICRKTYEDAAGVVSALDAVESIGQLRNLYKMNSVIVDANPEIKEMFSSLKKELTDGK